MKKLILILLLALPVYAQNPGSVSTVRHGDALPATCSPTAGQVFFLNNDGLYQCTATNTWTKPSGSGGGLTGVQTVDGTTNVTIQDAVTAAGTSQGVVIPSTYAGHDTFTNLNNRPVLDLRKIGDFRGGDVSVKDFGADGNGGFYYNTTCTNGSGTISNAFATTGSTPTSGMTLVVSGCGAAGADLSCTISSFNSGAHTITCGGGVTAAATLTGRGAHWGYATDDTAAFQSAVDACANLAMGGCTVRVPPGLYFISTINVPAAPGGVDRAGRINFKGAGRDAARLVGIGADQTAIISAPANSVPLGVGGLGLSSFDYNNKKSSGVVIAGGTQHTIEDNYFGNLYDGVKASNTWLNVINNNRFYSPQRCIYFPSGANGGNGPVNATWIQHNEFGACALYSYFNESNGSGGSNGNVVRDNSFEGTLTTTIADVDDDTNWGVFKDNRFETGGSSVGGYQSYIARGSLNQIDMTFCGSSISILGADNLVTCASTSGVITNSNFNNFQGQVTTANLSSPIGATIYSSNRTGIAVDANNGAVRLGTGLTGATKTSPYLTLNGKTVRLINGTSTNPTYPNCNGGTDTFAAGDLVFNKLAGTSGSVTADQVLGWMCTNGAGCSCNPVVATDWREFGALSSKERREGTAAPVSGAWTQGDFIWNTTPSGASPIIGWTNTVAGSPGTFVPLTAIDPTKPPAFGATTPNSGAFSTLSATGNESVSGNSTITGNSQANIYTATAAVKTPDIIASGPAVWLKADDGTSCTVDGTATTTWTDSAATPHNATNTGGADRPTCKTNIINGKPVFRFAGSQKFAQASWSAVQPSDVFIVYKHTAGSASNFLLDAVAGANLQSMAFLSPSTTFRILANAPASPPGVSDSSWTDDGAFHIVHALFNTTSSVLYLDGTQRGTGSVGTGAPGGFIVGQSGGGTLGFNGDVAEVIVFSSVLSSADRASVDYYLANKYNLTISDTPKPFSSTGFNVNVAGKTSVSGLSEGLSSVTFSATPTFDASAANTFKITLTANVTSSTLSNAVAGQPLSFVICQDGTGSRTFVWPTNMTGAMTIGTTASKCNAQSFIFDGTNAVATSQGVTNQ